MRIKWKQVPSVTMGGKLYFWIASDYSSRVVWNRFVHKWEASVGELSLGYFKTGALAKSAVESLTTQ